MLEKLLAARGVERRDICARHLYYANTVTQDAHRPPCARHPAQTAQSNALVTAYRESRDRGVRMSVRVHTHMCLSIGHVSLTILREIIASGHAQNLSHENTAAERQGIAIGVSVREQTAERLQRERADNIRFTVQREGRPNPSRPDPAGGPRRAWATSLRGAPCRSSRSSPRASRWRRPWRCSPSPR